MNRFVNKIILMSVAIVLGMMGLVSCEDYLDKSPDSDISEEEAFKNFRNFQGFTEELYNCIPLVSANDYHNNWNFGEDELWQLNEPRFLAYAIDQGNYWAWNTAGYTWFRANVDLVRNQDRLLKGRLYGMSWYAIRKANVGIDNLDQLVSATDEEKNLIAGQLYFFRGWFHFMLMQYWGGLAYVDQNIDPTQPMRLNRLNYQETAEKAAADFQKAAELLPVNWDETTVGKTTLGNNNLRINKIMALAYLGKNYLWAGSPLMNKESKGVAAYNTDYCKRAADAFALALKLTEETKRYELASFAEYRQLFYNNARNRVPGLKEAIFMENLINLDGRWRWNQVSDYRPKPIINGGLKCYPTANYVNYYGMANGMPIPSVAQKDEKSGYDPEYPWRNRDPRFYNDIIFDGVKCASNGTGGEYQQYASLFSETTYKNAKYRYYDPATGCMTGYLNSKFTDQLVGENELRDNNAFVLSFMRLADVYLMYAEAVTNGYGTPQSNADGYALTAIEAVNKIRQRAGVGNIASDFLGSTESFMSELRRERAVELAFEGHRFVDLRRWLLLTQKPYTLKTAIYFDRDPKTPNKTLYADPKNGHVLNLTEKVVVERILGDRHYWFPFLESDVNMYPGFKQNPGW